MPTSTSASLLPLNRRAALFPLFMIALLPLFASAQANTPSEPSLSAAETAAINKQIATLHTAADRGLAKEWTNAKKVAETLCRPAAKIALKKQLPGTDRFFLGTDDPKTLKLESNEKLTGSGTARTPKGWQDFTFTCELDPATAKVTSFTPTVTAAAK